LIDKRYNTEVQTKLICDKKITLDHNNIQKEFLSQRHGDLLELDYGTEKGEITTT
jgi:hypothetical protein